MTCWCRPCLLPTRSRSWPASRATSAASPIRCPPNSRDCRSPRRSGVPPATANSTARADWWPYRRAWPTTCRRNSASMRSGCGSLPIPSTFAAIRALAAEPCPARPDEPYLLHVGRFAAQKRHDLLLAAFAHAGLSQRLVLLTPPDARLDALIAGAGLERRVTIADFQVNPYPWMAGADLLVLCSDHEGLPNVLIEGAGLRDAYGQHRLPRPGRARSCGGELARWLVPCNDAERTGQPRWSPMHWRRRCPHPRSSRQRSRLTPQRVRWTAWEALAREISDVRHPARRRRRLPF
jgi:glycosyltransferase involved in cell wall biosynthesis